MAVLLFCIWLLCYFVLQVYVFITFSLTVRIVELCLLMFSRCCEVNSGAVLVDVFKVL